MRKGGISAIVATVLLILITVAAVTIIWVAVVPMITGFVDSSTITSKLSGENAYIRYAGPGDEESTLRIELKRGRSKLDAVDFKVVTDTVTETEYIPTDILFLADLSSSMATMEVSVGKTREQIMNDSAHEFVDEVFIRNPEAKVALMGFYNDDYPFHDFTGKDDKALLHEFINDEFYARSGTYLYTGLQNSYDKFLGSAAEQKVLIVLGDGDVTDASDDVTIAYISNFVNKGINVSTIGFGTGASSVLFISIASAGGGTYNDASDVNDLTDVFLNILEGIPDTHLVEREVMSEGVFFDFAIFSGGNSYIHRVKRNVPGPNEGRTYDIPLENGWTVEDIEKVEVYIVAVSDGGKENSVLLSRYKLT